MFPSLPSTARPTTLATITGAILASWTGAAAPAGAQESDEGSYGVVLFEESVMVPMRDGVRLATDVYRPTEAGSLVEDPLPVLLHRTPYGKGGSGLTRQARLFASHGYVVMIQDTRGNYASEGVFEKYFDFDAYDGFDTLEWIATLDYTTGDVGMWGTSYAAHTQADAAKLDPPNLGTVVLNMGGTSNGWTHKIRNHGAFELGQQLGWALDQVRNETDDPVVRAMLEREAVGDWLPAMPVREGLNPLSIAPSFERYVMDQMTKGDYGDWTGLGVNWSEYYEDTADIPMVHVGGWYDSYARGTVESWTELSKLKSSPMHLVMGPWDHGGNARPYAGDVAFGEESTIPDFHDEFHIRWFDHHLKGEDRGLGDWPAIRLFVMGTGDGHRDRDGRLHHGGTWIEASEWPLPDTELVPYYFHGDGSLSRERPDGSPSSTTYRFDPHHPVPTIGGSFSGTLKRGAYDQRETKFEDFRPMRSEAGFYGSREPYLPLKARPDVVVFQTEPLEEDVAVVGPIVVRLYASSTAVDTDFTVKLVDVYPPSEDFPTGFEMNVTDGILRARYRDSPERQELMEPGTVYEFVIEPFPTANVFKRGNRIRIDVSSSNWPRFDVNPNTGDPLGRHRRMIPADNTIHHGPEHPSHVVLPIVPLER